jgi:hypothetical protein
MYNSMISLLVTARRFTTAPVMSPTVPVVTAMPTTAPVVTAMPTTVPVVTQTLSHNLVSSTSGLSGVRIHNIIDCIGSCKLNYHTITTMGVLSNKCIMIVSSSL